MKYEIYALKCGSTLTPAPIVCYQTDFGKKYPLNYYFWVIKNSDKTIVVDTGMRDTYAEEYIPLCPDEEISRGPDEDTRSCLKKVNVNPDKVHYLILSHLHYDHASNVRLFSKAEIYVSKKGWLEVMAPKYAQLLPAVIFPRDVFAYLADEDWARLHLVGNEEEILPGIRIFWIGGHSVCSQAVAVETTKGTSVITGDTVMIYKNIEGDIPVGLAYSLPECYDAMRRIREEAKIVLPGHDPDVLRRFPSGRIP